MAPYEDFSIADTHSGNFMNICLFAWRLLILNQDGLKCFHVAPAVEMSERKAQSFPF